jgi:hypothetical protein
VRLFAWHGYVVRAAVLYAVHGNVAYVDARPGWDAAGPRGTPAGRPAVIREVALDVQIGGEWRHVGGVAEVEPCGSLSSDDGRREVIVFGFRDGTAGVWRSVGGLDAETTLGRTILTTGMEMLSDLSRPLELTVWRNGQHVRARFSVVHGGPA